MEVSLASRPLALRRATYSNHFHSFRHHGLRIRFVRVSRYSADLPLLAQLRVV
jgi:hypothetical protein